MTKRLMGPMQGYEIFSKDAQGHGRTFDQEYSCVGKQADDRETGFDKNTRLRQSRQVLDVVRIWRAAGGRVMTQSICTISCHAADAKPGLPS